VGGRPPGEAFLLPVHEIRHKPVLPCGVNILVVCAIAATLRNSHEQVEPVLVEQRGGWLLLDGRHRWVAHLVAGREQIRCVEQEPDGGAPCR
jgi:hypothetical protein